ncbi:MAG: hypothetical protein Q9190_004509 [Brigantiaea leucoxantha]
MPFTLRTTEPHPTTTSSSRLPTGRGGAGNFTRPPPPSALPTTTSYLNPSSAAAVKAATASTSTSAITSQRYYATGRGGAGNYHSVADPQERPVFKFDEELERERRGSECNVPVYHVGRGGAGNLVVDRRENANGNGSARSSSDGGSVRSR